MTINKISPLTYYILAWFGLPFMAIFNGILREYAYCNLVGEERAHQVSAVLLSIIICFYVLILNSSLTLKSWHEAVVVGSVWLVLTVLFEFFLGVMRGGPWDTQKENYDILHGNLWLLVLLSVFLAPILLRTQKITHVAS